MQAAAQTASDRADKHTDDRIAANTAAAAAAASGHMQPPPPRDTHPAGPSGFANFRSDAAGQKQLQAAEGVSAAAAMAAMAYRPASGDGDKGHGAANAPLPPASDHDELTKPEHGGGQLGHPSMTANGQMMDASGHMMSRPRGRAPRGKMWSEAAGKWLDDGSLVHQPISGVTRPRGRAPRGKSWDRAGGTWIDEQVPARRAPRGKTWSKAAGNWLDDGSMGHQPISGVTRPRGPAPRGKSWDRAGGIWIDEQVPANPFGIGGDLQPGVSAAGARMHPQPGDMPQDAMAPATMQMMQGGGVPTGPNGQPIAQMVSEGR